MANLLTVGQPLPELDLLTTDGAATSIEEPSYETILQTLREVPHA